MTALESTTPECPFCGQKILHIDAHEDARMHCHCGEALRYQNRRRSYDRTMSFLARAFGPECGAQNPAWKPADPETMLHLQRCVEFVTIGGHDRITVDMNDGSKAVISSGMVKRKVGFEMKVEA